MRWSAWIFPLDSLIRLSVLANFLIRSSSSQKAAAPHNDIGFFDSTSNDYETVLTPIDFGQALQINDNPRGNGVDLLDDSWDSEAMYATDKFEGDISNDLNASTVSMFILGAPENISDGNIQLNAIKDRRQFFVVLKQLWRPRTSIYEFRQLWRNGRIPYAISSQYSSFSRSVIAAAMQEYSKHTCIRWAPRTAEDHDYVYIYPERGCYSMVGRTGGKQILSLGNGCIQKGIIMHEMMHATGFFHEQSRTDRDEHIDIVWQNIIPGMQGQFEKYSTAMIQTLGTEYDYSSIMHYGPTAFSRNGLPTIVPKMRAVIGQRSGFSRIDSYKINYLYDCQNYGGVAGAPTPQIASQRPSPSLPPPPPAFATLAPPMTTTTSKPPPLPPATTQPSQPVPDIQPSSIRLINETGPCKNTRPDCDDLARQGWCTRNPNWMREHCPLSCSFCSKPAEEVCEDLRVDCAELVRRRYCLTAKSFTRAFCARSCGFCFVAPTTEQPAAVTLAPADKGSTDPRPTAGPSMVTFWPVIRQLVTSSSLQPKTRVCRDRKHFCLTWSKMGFCQGIFQDYMKKTCCISCR